MEISQPPFLRQKRPSIWKEDLKKARKIAIKLLHRYGIEEPKNNFVSLIPPHIEKLILEEGIDSAIAKQYLFHSDEISEDQFFGKDDPISDQNHLVVPGLIHRYGNRALYLPTDQCPVHCRYCFRRNEIFNKNVKDVFRPNKQLISNYLTNHPNINEIIFTGGDPLILDENQLNHHISIFSKIESIKFLRLHTRFPLAIPGRINQDLLDVLSLSQENFSQILIVIHVNHHKEISEEVEQSLKKLNSIGVKVLSQSVLLKGVNDSSDELRLLFEKLSENGVIPYYLHHPDQVRGGLHFYVSIEKGRQIYLELRDKLSGWQVPQYVIDLPNGGGKIPLFNPEKFCHSGEIIDRYGSKLKLSEPKASFS